MHIFGNYAVGLLSRVLVLLHYLLEQLVQVSDCRVVLQNAVGHHEHRPFDGLLVLDQFYYQVVFRSLAFVLEPYSLFAKIQDSEKV